MLAIFGMVIPMLDSVKTTICIHKALFIAASVLLYILIFTLAYIVIGRTAIAFSLIPLTCAASILGRWGGFVSGLLFVPLNLALFMLSGEYGSTLLVGKNFWASHLGLICIGFIVGHLSDLNTQYRESEARLRRAELTSKSGNWELHLDSKIMYGSEGAIKLYGVDKDQFEYTHMKSIPLPEYRQLLDTALKNLIENNKPYDVEFKIKTADTGEIKDIHSTAIFDKEKRILFGIIQDITKHKQVEEALRQSEVKFRDLVDMLPQIVFETDLKGNLTFVNQNAFNSFGYTKDDVASGLKVMQMIAPKDRDRAADRIRQIMRGPSDLIGSEYIAIKKDGTEFPVNHILDQIPV